MKGGDSKGERVKEGGEKVYVSRQIDEKGERIREERRGKKEGGSVQSIKEQH